MIYFGGTSSTYWLWMIESTSVKGRRFSYVAAESLLLLATPPPSDSVSRSRSAEIVTTFFTCRIEPMGNLRLALCRSLLRSVIAPDATHPRGLSHCDGSCGLPECRTSK